MDIQTVKKVARLSRLISFVEQLNTVDTRNVQPLTSVANVTLPYRQDVINDGNQQEAVLQNAPEKSHGFFVVPKVVG